jgi:tRNA-dihydrouridine synthase
VGNGDVANRLEAEAVCQKTGFDGVMIGRGIFQNPWAFETKTHEHTLAERLSALNRHLDIFEDTWAEGEKRFEPLKRFFKIYIHGFEGAAGLRAQLMECRNIHAVRELISAQSTS